MISKKIKPSVAYCNGKRMIAEKLRVVSVSDNLFDDVTFQYTLFTSQDEYAGESVFRLHGDDYKKWDASAEGAYRIVCEGIGLEFEPTVGGSFFGE